jgi:hypothetical protein
MPALLPIISGLWSFATSQVGVLMIAILLSYGYGHHKASLACDEREAVYRAEMVKAHAAELARQQKAAEAIAIADMKRADEAVQAADAMQQEIESLKMRVVKRGDGHAKDGGCVVDGDYARRVQRLDRAGRH